jgi:hypothetical protein
LTKRKAERIPESNLASKKKIGNLKFKFKIFN